MALKGSDVAQHASAESCWVIVHGKAYDVTDFLPGAYAFHGAVWWREALMVR